MLLGCVGIGLSGAGIFTADPLNGYPPGTPVLPIVRTADGILHDLFGIPVFLGLPLACLVFARRFRRLNEPGWATYSGLTGLAMYVAFVLARLGFSQRALVDFPGGLQRVSLIMSTTWIVLLAAHMLRSHLHDSATISA